MQRAKLFRNGGSQAVRLPKNVRFAGSEVVIRKHGDGILILPASDRMTMLRHSLEQFSDDFMQQRDQGEHQGRDGF